MALRFVKMHGLGNDYVYVDAMDPAVEVGRDWAALTRAISDRHTGVGSDGLILIARPTPSAASGGAAVRMRMFNADGSESEMCGNGVRCVAKFAHDRLGVRAQPMLVETGAGVLSIDGRASAGRLTEATVDMGAPTLALDRIPVNSAALSALGAEHEHQIGVAGRRFGVVFVSMGNPHAVVFDQGLDVAALGRAFEHHPAFPARVNVHAVRVRSPQHAEMATWERGAGLTQACGTGACAVLVAGVLTGRLARACDLTLPGGTLHVRWDQATGHIFMTGPATEVFEGVWPD